MTLALFDVGGGLRGNNRRRTSSKIRLKNN